MADYQRLSDLVLEALKLAIEQEDKEVSQQLVKTLELAMTRKSGGAGFVERREFTEDVENVLEKASSLANK